MRQRKRGVSEEEFELAGIQDDATASASEKDELEEMLEFAGDLGVLLEKIVHQAVSPAAGGIESIRQSSRLVAAKIIGFANR